MNLEKIADKENFFSRIGKTIADTASAIYHNTVFKVAAPIILAASITGCKNPMHQNVELPKQHIKAELNTQHKGSGIRVNGVVGDINKPYGFDVDIDDTSSRISGPDNRIDETRLIVSGSIPWKGYTFTPVISLVDNQTIERPYLSNPELETSLAFPFLAVGVGKRFRTKGNEHSLLLRPYVTQSRTELFTGDTNKLTRYGIYGELDQAISIARILYTLSLEREDFDFETGISNFTELQAGASFSGELDNFLGSIGGALVFTRDDDHYSGIDSKTRAVLTGDATFVLGNHSAGGHLSYDGDLFSIGAHATFGGNGPENARRLSNYLRQLQRSTIIERGLPEQQNKKDDARLSMEQGLDSLAFVLAGVRQEYDTLATDANANLYLHAGGIFKIKDKRVSAGYTFGPVFDIYPVDVVNSRNGFLATLDLDDKGFYCLLLEHIEYENREDQDLFQLKAVYKF